MFADQGADLSQQLVPAVEALLEDLLDPSLEMAAILGVEVGGRHDHDRNLPGVGVLREPPR